ncbi:MAG: aspartate 1-decarboxylase [Leptospiraceae bacterium]|nr:aspartate 1-decarboxylase [Leptospiraceae bacterium]
MLITILKSKIHRATITDANLNYIGSLTVDLDLMDAAGMIEYQQVAVVNINNGARLETYLIKGKRGSGEICLNGAAARLGEPGDKIIIMTYCMVEEKEVPANYDPKVVHVDGKNHIIQP